jgi:(R,R)-butanediol dehydrogenase/meso-butanediol dehydrogenase/diacetyl reductase
MKAAVFHRSGTPLSIENVDDPQPLPGEMILKVCACGICGTDLHWSEINNEESGWRDIFPGAVMGHEFAGEIVELGRDVPKHWKIGDRVCAMPQLGCGVCAACHSGKPHRCLNGKTRASAECPGAYAEYTRIGTQETLHLPANVSFAEGALVEPLAVGLHAVRRARLNLGDNILIVGGGPVGLSVALWCRFFGARNIIVSDLIAGRAKGAGAFGATAAIDASTEDVSERFVELAGGAPTVVVDAVGVPGSMQTAIDYAPIDGRVVVVGLCMVPDRFKPAEAVIKEIDLSFCFVYEKRDFIMTLDMLAQGRINAAGLISHTVGFDAFPESFEALKRPSDQIKVMLEPD